MGKKIVGMAGKVAGPKGSWQRRWSVLLSLVLAVGMAMVVKQTVFAVHEFFDLEGDVVENGLTDWADLFNTDGSTKNSLPLGVDHAALARDFITNANGSFNNADVTTFTTGSKDTLPISGWQCTRSNNVTDKDDIVNAYAATFTNALGQDILYFGIERNARTGSANIGFWFLQGAIACSSPGGAVTFTGEHQDGDLLIVSEFSNGGDVSTIKVYRWNGGATGSLSAVEAASGVDCRDPLHPETGDTVCGAANRVGITVPWLTAEKTDGVGQSLRQGEFFEGGLNLSLSGLGGKCFNTFLANTRTSTSTTSTIFDYTQGTIGQCQSSTVTTPNITTPTVIPVNAQLSVHDTAVISVDGVTSFNGRVKFFLCGPNTTQTLCATGGVEVSTETITTNGSVQSDSVTITSVGHYCWRAEFTEVSNPAIGVPPSSDARASECFQITPRTPDIVTTAGAGPVTFGSPVTDTGTLSGTAAHPGTGGAGNGSINPTAGPTPAVGTITFTLVKDNPANPTNRCGANATGTGTNPQTVNVSGDGSYGPVSFTPDAPGTYHWLASYSGDSPNTNPKSHNLMCLDTNERVVVQQIATTLKTRQGWFPNDTATVAAASGNLGAGGSVVFSLYDNATCSGTAKYSETKSITGGATSQEVATNNTTFPITSLYTDPANTAVIYSWKVVYTPAAGDTAHTGKQSACNAERFTLTYTNDNGPGTNLP